MPINKVPIVHKFGIISHSQRLELQERLLKQTYLQALEDEPKYAQYRNALEVTDDFISQFNAAKGFADKEKFEDQAYKMLERIKRRSGLREGGKGNHVDLALAWTELSQLAQCKGKIQEDCLDVLVSSLDQSPLCGSHIPAMFYLAEMCLYWLRTDIVNQPYLRTAEIKLLKMGQLVLTRLFFHHMSGQLANKQDYKKRLFTYLDGFENCQEAYSPYPNALLSIRYIDEVGKIVIADTRQGAGVEQPDDSDAKEHSVTTVKTESQDVSQHESEIFREVATNIEKLSTIESNNIMRISSGNTGVSEKTVTSQKTGASGALSSSVHDLSPTLWHSMDVWRCTSMFGGGLDDALGALSRCGAALVNENWVDVMTALTILAEAAKINMSTLRGLQNLARGIVVAKKLPPDKPNNATNSSFGSESGSTEMINTISDSTKASLSDIYERTEDDSEMSHIDSSDKPASQTDEHATSRDQSVDKIDSVSQSDLNGVLAASQCSSSGAGFVKPTVEILGMHGWRWEIAVTYADLLADIVLHGGTSNIQKRALVGVNQEYNDISKRQTCVHPMKSAGLLDLVFFRTANEKRDWGPNDWSWKIRYSAIQGLVKICQCLSGDKNREGIHTVAWNTVLQAHAKENDSRVLEALKVGQVDANIENMIRRNLSVPPSALASKIATNLASAYLPPLPPLIKTPTPRKEKLQRQVSDSTLHLKVAKSPRKPLRTSLKAEIQLTTALSEKPPDFNARTSFDLKRIVEDQWRKELQTKLSEEESELIAEHERERKTDDENRLKTIENKNRKFQNKGRIKDGKKEKSTDC